MTNFRRGTARAEDAQETPTQSHISSSILVYEDNRSKLERGADPCWRGCGAGRPIAKPLWSEHGTYKTVKARFWPLFQVKALGVPSFLGSGRLGTRP